jgi:hypothetical protein
MPPNDADPKVELMRLKSKLSTVQDRDIKAALQARVDELTAQVEAQIEAVLKTAPKELEVPTELPPPPTPEQSEQAEKLLRQAMLEKRRGNQEAVTKLLEEAVAAAPGAPATLEALGDEFAERKRTKQALEYYKRAIELDPKNVGLERKHAELALRTAMMGSFESQLRAGDSFFIGMGDNTASMGTARILSFFAPGLGHLVLGRTFAGFAMLGTWIACLVWLFIQKDDIAGLMRTVMGHSTPYSGGVFPPLIIAAITLVIAVGSLGGAKASVHRAQKKPHPKPPVDLPFD